MRVCIKALLCLYFVVSNVVLSSDAQQIDIVTKKPIEVRFWNVGQGNCTLIKSPEKEQDPNGNVLRRQLLIVDAGTSQYPEELVVKCGNTASANKDLLTSISKWIGNFSHYDAHIILSHPDNDHINLIAPLIQDSIQRKKQSSQPNLFMQEMQSFVLDEKCFNHITLYVSQKFCTDGQNNFNESYLLNRYKLPEALKKNLGLISIKTAESLFLESYIENNLELAKIYQKEEKEKKLKEQKDLEFFCVEKIFGKRKSDESSPQDYFLKKNKQPFFLGGMEVHFINNPYDIQSIDSNDNSLIVKVTYDKKSILLTGDATKRTIDSIKLELKPLIQDITIFQAAHHGANTDGSNNADFIKSTNPLYTVFSSHRYSQYEHPDWRTVVRFCKNWNHADFPDNYHLLFLNSYVTANKLTDQDYFLANNNGHFLKAVASYSKTDKDNEGNLLDRRPYGVYVTNYPIFHTGSNKTLEFKWEKDSGNGIELTAHDHEGKLLFLQSSKLEETFTHLCKNINQKSAAGIDGLNVLGRFNYPKESENEEQSSSESNNQIESKHINDLLYEQIFADKIFPSISVIRLDQATFTNFLDPAFAALIQERHRDNEENSTIYLNESQIQQDTKDQFSQHSVIFEKPKTNQKKQQTEEVKKVKK